MNIFVLLASSCLLITTVYPDQDTTLYARAEEIIASPKIDTIVQNSEQLTERFTDPAFLEPLINIEAHKAAQQQAWNQELVTTLKLPYVDAFPPIGIYNGDLMRTGIASAAWALEWWLHSTVTHAITTTLTTHWLTGQHDAQSVTLPFKNLLTPHLLRVLAAYSIAVVIMQHGYTSYQLNAKTTLQDPTPLWAFVNSPYTNILNILNPQNWTSSINTLFKNVGLLDAWADANWLLISKEMAVNLAWLHSYVTNVVAPNIEKNIAPHADKLKEALEPFDTILPVVHAQLHNPFMPWMSQKIFYTSVGHSVCNVLVATPAWYRLCSGLYTLMKALNQPDVKD